MCKYLSKENYHGKVVFADKSIEIDRFATLDDVMKNCEVRVGKIEEVKKDSRTELSRPDFRSVDAVAMTVLLGSGRETLYLDRKDLLKETGTSSYLLLFEKELSCYVMTAEKAGVAENRNIFMIAFDKGPYSKGR